MKRLLGLALLLLALNAQATVTWTCTIDKANGAFRFLVTADEPFQIEWSADFVHWFYVWRSPYLPGLLLDYDQSVVGLVDLSPMGFFRVKAVGELTPIQIGLARQRNAPTLHKDSCEKTLN